jgi:hypothetical protein
MKTSGAITSRYGHQKKYSLLSITEIVPYYLSARVSMNYTNRTINRQNTTFTFNLKTTKLKQYERKIFKYNGRLSGMERSHEFNSEIV